MPLFVNAEKLPYGGRFGVIEQNRPYQTSDLLQKNETHFPRCVGPPKPRSDCVPFDLFTTKEALRQTIYDALQILVLSSQFNSDVSAGILGMIFFQLVSCLVSIIIS